ncbi:outer membrane protein transport protein [uncultured Desulfobulbus sp.]|uniref:OmpP1/FadL family transporter n=1 Tax=uncultured Desulfobulbus sp. TaxID=239745 RepID=UPI0029C76CA9|nr:outer membrane protein transport protein [uncultured Desulfobulbus sp.]
MINTKMVRPLIALVLLALAGQANAGGLYLYELGTEDLGLANAGSAARAQDASTIASNPAGMTRLQGNQMVIGAQLLYGDLEYELNDSNLNGPGNIVGWLPGSSLFYSHSVSDDLKLGMALYGNFGLSMSFDDNWSGHNLVKDATLMGLTLQPSLAYRMSNKWSIGAGLGINYGIFSLTRDKLAVFGGDEVELDDTDIAPNVKVGVLFEPSARTRLGLTYTSKVDYNFDVDANGTLPTGRAWSLPINAMLDAPQQIMFSAVQVLNDHWSLLGELGWQDWSTLSEMEITVGPVTQTSRLDLQDTWHGALGVQYQLTADTRLNFGVAYDTSMYDDQDNISFVLPSGAAWRFGTGVQRQLSERSSLGVAFEYLLMEDGKAVNPEVLAGSYDNPQMYFISVNYSYRF